MFRSVLFNFSNEASAPSLTEGPKSRLPSCLIDAPMRAIVIACLIGGSVGSVAALKPDPRCADKTKAIPTHLCIHEPYDVPKTKVPQDPIKHSDPKKFQTCVQTMAKQQQMKGADASIYCMKSYNP